MGCLFEFFAELILEFAFSREHLKGTLTEQDIRVYRRLHIVAIILFDVALVLCLYTAITTIEKWVFLLVFGCIWLIIRHVKNIERLDRM